MSDPVYTATVNFEDGVHLPHTVVTITYNGDTYTVTDGPEVVALVTAIHAILDATTTD
jgi:hypothetical protein